MKSQQETIKILEDHGIRVVMKPVALLPNMYHDFDSHSVGVIETDIYEALEKLETIKKISKDPFS